MIRLVQFIKEDWCSSVFVREKSSSSGMWFTWDACSASSPQSKQTAKTWVVLTIYLYKMLNCIVARTIEVFFIFRKLLFMFLSQSEDTRFNNDHVDLTMNFLPWNTQYIVLRTMESRMNWEQRSSEELHWWLILQNTQHIEKHFVTDHSDTAFKCK